MMWKEIEARIAENDAEKAVPMRRDLLNALREVQVRPLLGATKKMVGLELPGGERLVWELTGAAANFFVASKWADALSRERLSCELRPFFRGEKDGKRHSGLNRAYSFPDQDCLRVLVEGEVDLRRLIEVVDGEPVAKGLNPNAVNRWLARLRLFFPDLDRFDRPDPAFDSRERDYKLQVAERMRADIAAALDDAAVLAAVHSGLVKSNLLPWRAYWSMSPKGDGDAARLAPALRVLVTAAQGPGEYHPQALAAFAAVWAKAVPDPQSDHPRQIGEFVLMHLAPEFGIYIRHSVRENFWREGFGTKFPASADVAETYRNELTFMRAVRNAFSACGLAPRDMIDIQSALWVVHNYTDKDAEASAQPEMKMLDVVPPTNLILYGPPGTGKTYQTAWEAVRLCLGDAEARQFLGSDKRNALMSEYRHLVDCGRIEFVTFHQSMSYEEFVEGLRPTTGPSPDLEAPQDEEDSPGFRLEPQDGIFKRISERAANDRGDTGAGGLDRTRRIYRLGLTGGDWKRDLQRALDEKEIAWGFGGDTDWSAPEYEDWQAIKQRRKVDDISVKGNHATVYGTWLVRSGAADGAYVILTSGRNRAVAFGRVAGDYKFTPSSEGAVARHTRPVEWIWNDPAGVDRSAFYETPFTSLHPIYPLQREMIDWPALESLVLGSDVRAANPRPHILIIDEVNRANISKVFGELITLLEPDKRLGTANEIQLTLPYSKKRFGVPSNLHIIATMNTADRSIALLDTALRRRFTFRELMPEPLMLPSDVEGINLQALLRTINERIEYLFDREHQIGHAYFTDCDTRAKIATVMRYKIIPLLAEYFYEDWSKVAAVLGDAEQTNSRFLVREVITVPNGLETDTFSGTRYRWRVRPEVQGEETGGFDFSEFEA